MGARVSNPVALDRRSTCGYKKRSFRRPKRPDSTRAARRRSRGAATGRSVHETLLQHEQPGAAGAAAQGAVYALWLTAAFAVAAYAGGDRYPGYFLFWTALLFAVALVVPLAALGAASHRLRRLAPTGGLAAAFCLLLAAAPSLDVGPALRASPGLAAARWGLLAVSVALAAWNLRRVRVSRLGLGQAMAVACVAWCVCGLLRTGDASQALWRQAVLLPPAAVVALLLAGLPRFGAVQSPFHIGTTLAAFAVLALLPLRPRVPLPAPLAAGAVAGVAAPAGGRSAVLIVLDTVRRDRMSLYGYARKTTPAIDRIAARGLVFEDSTSVDAWTLPSHASMFTGLWPRTHGAHAFRDDKNGSIVISPLPPERRTLAQIARQHGYRTAGLSSNHLYMAPRWGVHRGFQEYLCRRPRLSGLLLGSARELARWWDRRRAQYQEMPYFTAPEMTRAAISWLDRNRDVPFFLFLNYMDAHTPNAAPGSQGVPLEGEESSAAAERHEMHNHYLSGGEISNGERRRILNEYDREMIHLDRWVGVLLDHLETSGLSARTMVVLTSDHGEFLGEHHLLGHSKDLYAEGVEVPLIVWEPGVTPGRVTRPVQSHDLFPTILRYLGLPIPEGTQGQPVHEAVHAPVSELYYVLDQWLLQSAYRHRFDRVLRSIRVGGHRYFRSSNGEERLFDLGVDPRETDDLMSERPDVAASARLRLDEWLGRTPEAPPPVVPPEELDAEALENLRTLGYVR
jgi:arylsulfatase A-like enzyme